MRRRSWMSLGLIMSGLSLPAAASSPEQRGLAIARKADRANSGFRGESMELEMVLINAQGERIKRRLDMKIKETRGDGDKSFITFQWPADVKGTRLLTWAHGRRQDDQWLYLPAINRVKRISARNKSGSFMGSEFAYEDLSSEEVAKYTYRHLDDVVERGRKAWRIQRVPVDRRSGYSKQIVWMDKQYLNPIRIDFYDRKGELLKTATFSGYRRYGRWWRWRKVHMVNHQTRKKSTFISRKRSLGKRYSDEDFESDNLQG